MLNSRLSLKQRFEAVEPREAPSLRTQDIVTTSQARQVQQGLGSDYLFWGSVTIMGRQAGLDLNYLDPEGHNEKKTASVEFDELIPVLEELSREVKREIFDEYLPKQKSASAEPVTSSSRPASTQSQEQAGQSPQEYYLNPAIDYKGMHSGRWRSQALPFVGTGLAVGDADANGQKEIFIMQEHGITAYHVQEKGLHRLSTYSIAGNNQCLNINLLDFENDGVLEIVVSNRNHGKASSFILRFSNDLFQVVRKDIPLYLNVVPLPPRYEKTLIGQKDGFRGELFQKGVHEVVSMSGKYQLGRQLRLPQEANVFNFVHLAQEKGYKIVVADTNDHLDVYSKSGDIQASTKERYASSAVGIELDMSHTGWGPDAVDRYYFLPSSLWPCNMDKDQRHELLVSRNISTAAAIFSNYREFPEGEMHCLYWTGVGLDSLWTTKRVQGSIADYGIWDLNEDENQDLVILITTHPGVAGLRNKKTFLLRYTLDFQEKAPAAAQ